MASNTVKTDSIRTRKSRKMGKGRKREVRRNGTTVKFPIHPETEASAR